MNLLYYRYYPFWIQKNFLTVLKHIYMIFYYDFNLEWIYFILFFNLIISKVMTYIVDIIHFEFKRVISRL